MALVLSVDPDEDDDDQPTEPGRVPGDSDDGRPY